MKVISHFLKSSLLRPFCAFMCAILVSGTVYSQKNDKLPKAGGNATKNSLTGITRGVDSTDVDDHIINTEVVKYEINQE